MQGVLISEEERGLERPMCVKHPFGTPLERNANSSDRHRVGHARALCAKTLGASLEPVASLFLEVLLEIKGDVGCRGESCGGGVHVRDVNEVSTDQWSPRVVFCQLETAIGLSGDSNVKGRGQLLRGL